MENNQYNEIIDKRLEKEQNEEKVTLADKAADTVAHFGGSWLFILIFIIFFSGWILFNIFVYKLDSYPFILLNLILSCLAVFQAPFILMSQNRISAIDRKRAENDYKIDLITEIEIQEINKKIDIILSKLPSA